MKDYTLITHDDLDGVGCEIIFRACGGEEVIVANYNNVDAIVEDILSRPTEEKNIIFADICPNDDALRALDKANFKSKIVLDHHNRKAIYPWMTVDKSRCGAYLLMLHLLKLDIEHFDVLKHYMYFVEIVDDYDRWIHKYEVSKDLNALFYIIGRYRFVTKMIDKEHGNVRFNETDKLLLALDKEDRQKYMYEAEKRVFKVADIPAVFCEQKYTSETGHHLLNELNLDVVLLIDTTNKKGSFRSKEGFDSSILAKRLGGGGHKQACGFQLTDQDLNDFIYNIVYPVCDMKLEECKEEN